MKKLLLLTLIFSSTLSIAANHRLCSEIEKANTVEMQYNIDLEDQVVFSYESDASNPYALELNSGFLTCTFNKAINKYEINIQKGHAVCVDMERINENEKKYNIPLEKQVIFSIEADDYNPEMIEFESGDLRCVRKANGKWKAVMRS